MSSHSLTIIVDLDIHALAQYRENIVGEENCVFIGRDLSGYLITQDRANACMNYAISKGIASDRISAIGYGETKPLVANDTKENKAKNRRTEFKIVN